MVGDIFTCLLAGLSRQRRRAAGERRRATPTGITAVAVQPGHVIVTFARKRRRYSTKMKDPALWLGLYGALLSALLAFVEVLRHRRRVKVSCGFAVAKVGNILLHNVVVSVVNRGPRPVVITEVAFALSDGRKVFGNCHPRLGVPLPKRLEDGDTVSVCVDARVWGLE
jgi:hypothetical protein